MASTPSASVSKRLVLVTVTAALGFFLFGYDTAVINGAIDALADHYGLGSGLKGFAVSSALLGCVIGSARHCRRSPSGASLVFLLQSLVATTHLRDQGVATTS